jgi:hypothetical protein
MTSISVTSIKKAIFELQEDSAQFTTQQRSDPQLSIRMTQLSVETLISVREDSEQLNIESLQ